MKTNALIYQFLIPIILTAIIFSCNKDENEEETSNTSTVQDVDGNTYQTIKIGDQWWMAENLNTTKFRNGENIPYLAGSNEWTSTLSAGYCHSNNDTTLGAVYGLLYNWHAVSDGRKICPEGWHSPNNNNWATLVEFLGGSDIAGGKLKQAGTDLWDSPNTDATNESGFSALPGGIRTPITGFFAGVGSTGSWWSNTQQNNEEAGVWGLTSMNGVIANYNLKKNTGMSVRCVKD